MVIKMLTINPFNLDTSLAGYFGWVIFLYVLHLAERWARQNYQQLSAFWHNHFPAPIRALVYTIFIFILAIYTQTQQSSFIYFKF
jgi:hypothetical protein